MNKMEQSRKLPLLPSERKIRIAKEGKTTSAVCSPTQVSNLEIKASDSESVTDEHATIPMKSAIASPQSPSSSLEHLQQERRGRDTETDRLSHVNPLPSSITAQKLLHFMASTTQFINGFEVEVGARLDSCSNKINSLDHKVSLMESRRRLDLQGHNEAAPSYQKKTLR